MKFLTVDGFQQVVDAVEAEGLHGIVVVGRSEDDVDGFRHGFQLLETESVAQLNVAKNEVYINFISKESPYLGITGTYANYFMFTFQHSPQTVGAALFVFYNQYSHHSMGINGIDTQYSSWVLLMTIFCDVSRR